MRMLLLLMVTCLGYAMENSPPTQAINAAHEQQPLLNVHGNEENLIRGAIIHCADHYAGAVICCGSMLCMGGIVVLGCWHAGGASAIKASRAVVVGAMQ